MKCTDSTVDSPISSAPVSLLVSMPAWWQKPFFSFYRAPWLKGWAGHTSSTVESELLLAIEYLHYYTYMIVTCTQSPLMSLLESWNWCFFLSPWMLKIFEEDIWFRLPNRRVASFILSFLAWWSLHHSWSQIASLWDVVLFLWIYLVSR